MNSFIPWVGGKSKLLWIINKMAPDHYSRFIDVFGGSGTVTMSRPIQQGCMEVYLLLTVGTIFNVFWLYRMRRQLQMKWCAVLILSVLHTAIGVYKMRAT